MLNVELMNEIFFKINRDFIFLDLKFKIQNSKFILCYG